MKEQSGLKKLSTTKKVIVILGLVVVVASIITFMVIRLSAQPAASSINSYQECADAAYPIQLSFPETCAVPGGKSFTNN